MQVLPTTNLAEKTPKKGSRTFLMLDDNDPSEITQVQTLIVDHPSRDNFKKEYCNYWGNGEGEYDGEYVIENTDPKYRTYFEVKDEEQAKQIIEDMDNLLSNLNDEVNTILDNFAALFVPSSKIVWN